MRCVVYVDGSFSLSEKDEIGIVGAGVVLIVEGLPEPLEFHVASADKTLTPMRNVSGEILASLLAVEFIETNCPQCTQIDIYHDYEGISKWVTGEWKANKALTQEYRDTMRNSQKSRKIKFFHVKSHSGVLYNERADAIAKFAVQEKALELGVSL